MLKGERLRATSHRLAKDHALVSHYETSCTNEPIWDLDD